MASSPGSLVRKYTNPSGREAIEMQLESFKEEYYELYNILVDFEKNMII